LSEEMQQKTTTEAVTGDNSSPVTCYAIGGKVQNVSPENITALQPGEIFVFGSNYSGRHGKGAALLAMRKFGAKPGQGVGLMGQSYGIATKDQRLKTLSLMAISAQIGKFIKFAAENPQLRFLVTQIGCGLAGYKPWEIAPLFFAYDIPANVALPAAFWKFKA
jgi:hypothetical protein